MRILILVPHMSTGGMPQVALKRVEALINKHEVYLIEYREIAWSFVVQRNKIKNLLGDRFISLGWIDKEEIRDHFQEIVEKINPDVIHMEEIPEMFIFGMRKEHSDWLYRKERTYKIIETTHTSTYNIDNKKYFPDKFLFVSKYSQNEYKKFDIPSSVVEYPVEKYEKNKSQSMRFLNFNPDYFHILNVGLFTRDKNQGYLFEIAKKLKDYKIHFHFVGNQAENFSDYWRPIMSDKPDSCFIYGERDDVEFFYQASDILIHPSILELNPLAIKEATSYELPVYLKNLSTYLGTYDSYKNIKYLTMNIDDDCKMILDNFNIKRKDDNDTFSDILIKEYKNILGENYTQPERKENEKTSLDYTISFIDGAKIEINSERKLDFDIEIFDKKDNSLIYKTVLSSNGWCSTNSKYYREYKIVIKYKGKVIINHEFDLKNKNALIVFDSKSLGDTLAWIPYVEEFRKKHNCNVYCMTFWNDWFISQYPEINFIYPGYNIDLKLYARYMLGWYSPFDKNKNPYDYKKQPLQKTASDILGLDFKEIVPKIETPEGVRPIKDKYVCIAQFSTANAKHWHYPAKDSNKGWQQLVDWLNEQGYKVMVISKQKTNLKNIIDKTGNFPIEHRVNELKWCEFFIGVGSGLSWLAWSLGKKVVMISGFSNPICEFKSNNINVHNFNVCNGCFNKHDFDRGDWNWCPEHKNTERHFECSINITPQMIVDRIVNAKLIQNPKPFDFSKYDLDIKLNKEDINFSYEKDTNKIILGYKGEIDTPEICVEFKDYHTKKTYHVVSDIKLSKNYLIWSISKDVIHEETDRILIVFYEKNKILEVDFGI